VDAITMTEHLVRGKDHIARQEAKEQFSGQALSFPTTLPKELTLTRIPGELCHSFPGQCPQ
jgi:hypothetical protein